MMPKDVRRIDFRVSDKMPALLEGDLAVWASEIRGGGKSIEGTGVDYLDYQGKLWDGIIPAGSLLAQKIKVADGLDYFVHFCRDGENNDWSKNKDAIIRTDTGLASQVLYQCRLKKNLKDDAMLDFDEGVIVDHDEVAGATWLTLKGGYHHESGISIPMSLQLTEEDGNNRTQFADSHVGLRVDTKTDNGIDWGVEAYGRRLFCGEGSPTLYTEIFRGGGPPLEVARTILPMLDAVRRQKKDLPELIELRSKKELLSEDWGEFVEYLQTNLNEVEDLLSGFESKILNETDRLKLIEMYEEFSKIYITTQKSSVDQDYNELVYKLFGEGCTTVCIEIPWNGSPSHVRRKVRAMLDAVRRQRKDLAELIIVRSERVCLSTLVKQDEEDLDELLEGIETKLSGFERDLFAETVKSKLVALADRISKELDGLEKAREGRFKAFVSEMADETLLTFRLMENEGTILTKAPVGVIESIKRAWVGNRTRVWDDMGSGGDDLTKNVIEAMREKGELCFNSDMAVRLTGMDMFRAGGSQGVKVRDVITMSGSFPQVQGTRRSLLVEVVAGDTCLRSDEEVMLLYLRSIIYEDIEVERKGKHFKKSLNDQASKFRGDLDEVEQLMEFAGNDDNGSNLEGKLRELKHGLEEEIKRLEFKATESFDWNTVYVGENFRQEVAMLKKTQENQFKNLKDITNMLNSQLKECQEEALKIESIRENIAAKKRQESDNLYQKGFSLRQILEFVELKSLQGKLKDVYTTAEVVFNIVIPETKEKGCCYADIFPGGPKPPETLMSHWWGNNFKDLVRAICEHASGITELDVSKHSEENLQKTYWLCIFGVNQHIAICHSVPGPCSCGKPKYSVGRIKCQMDKFEQVMESIPYHGLALDSELTTLKRVWVLSELSGAIRENKDTVYNGETRMLARNPNIPSIEDAEASYEADKIMIVDEIKRGVGVEAFDATISAAVKLKISILRTFQGAEDGKLDLVKEGIEGDKELINEKSGKGDGETLLQICCRKGHLDIVRFLLEQPGINVNERSRIEGDTALHIVTLWDPPDGDEIADLLMEAGAKG